MSVKLDRCAAALKVSWAFRKYGRVHFSREVPQDLPRAPASRIEVDPLGPRWRLRRWRCRSFFSLCHFQMLNERGSISREIKRGRDARGGSPEKRYSALFEVALGFGRSNYVAGPVVKRDRIRSRRDARNGICSHEHEWIFSAFTGTDTAEIWA